MNQPGHDYEAQRELERHALRNVSWLAEKLGYRDALDKRVEKKIIIAIGVFAIAALAVLVTGIIRSQTPPEEMARRRCEVQVRADETMEVRARVIREHPGMNGAQHDELVEKTIKAAAAQRCSGSLPAK